MSPRRVCVPLLFVVLAVPAVQADELADRIDAVVRAPAYRDARWGILVVDAATGQTVYARNADQSFTPGSTQKLYTCAAALAACGPEHKFRTPVYLTGAVENGRLDGNLVLVASGDPTLGGRTDSRGKMAYTDDDHTYANSLPARSSLTPTDPLAGLNDLARQVAASGVREVDGDVVIDDRLFDRENGSGTGPVLLTPIIVNDNVIDVELRPGARPGAAAQYRVVPETGFARGEVSVVTVPEGQPTSVEIYFRGPRRFEVRGQIARGSPPLVRIFPIEDPTAFARALFLEALRHEGVRVAADRSSPRLPERFDERQRIAVYTSPPLSELVRVTLKVSSNLYANLLPMHLAVKAGRRSLADGLREEKKILAGLGVDADEVSLGSGAGSTMADRTTPRAMVELLRALSKRLDWASFRHALPVLGEDGTLAELRGGGPARGNVRAKTGTVLRREGARQMLRSKALAGTMTTARGRTLLFAMFVNDVELARGASAAREGEALADLCEILYRHTP
jgi:serine-type D-Ala-D-Ala carboxypeptidase/endopeptidase (penicillin-binding protein 4)